MQVDSYEFESAVEEGHWWYKVRRQLFCSVIKEIGLNSESSIIDIGTSSGSNLRMLKDMGFKKYQGYDLSESSKFFCKMKGLGDVMVGDICESGLASESYDLVIASDVIEHIDDDSKAISEITRILKDGSHAIITVPCFMSLWGYTDEMAMHKRRYLLKEISQKIESAGLEIKDKFYFNFLLFFPIFCYRRLAKILSLKKRNELAVNCGPLNYVLEKLFAADVFLARKLKIVPFGVSAFLLVQKPLKKI